MSKHTRSEVSAHYQNYSLKMLCLTTGAMQVSYHRQVTYFDSDIFFWSRVILKNSCGQIRTFILRIDNTTERPISGTPVYP